MNGLLNPAARKSPVRFFGGAFSRRQLASLTLGASASLLLAPCGAFALSSPTLALSPEVAKSNLVSAMDPAAEIIIQLTLPLSDRQGAYDLMQHVSTPKDPLYRHYITAQEFAVRFGANAADYATLREWAVANGLSIVHESSARISLSLRGTVAQMQRLFKTQLNYYKAPSGDQFYSASVEPTIPSEIASKVQKVVGLTGGVQKASLYKIGKTPGEHPMTPAVRTDTAGGTGPGGTYGASDLRTAYQIPTFGGVRPEVVAVFEDSSIRTSDFRKYLNTNNLPPIKLTQIPVDQSTVSINGDEVEAVLDVDMIAAINPNVQEIQLYDAAGVNTIGQFSQELVDVFDAVATAASSPGGPSILSVSYGLDEIQIVGGGGDINAEEEALIELVDVGVTVFVSAGDQGAYGRTGLDNFPAQPATLNVSDPGSQIPVTCVGGTSLFTYQQQQYLGETVWNELGLRDGATGGGVSNVWSLPSDGFYQGSTLVELNGGSGTARNVPDVAAVADPLTGVGIYVKDAGGWIQIGGTSASSPIWAGYMSIVNAGGDFLGIGHVGFFDPLLYYTGTNFSGNNDALPAGLGVWYPVLGGSNGNFNLYGLAGYSAGFYYNNCCGLGSLFGPYAYQLLSALTVSSSLQPAGLKAVPTKTSATIKWDAVSGASGYGIYLDRLSPVGNPPTSFDLTGSALATVTGKTSIKIRGLATKGYYGVFVSAVDGSTFEVGTSTVEFQTK